MARSRFLCVCTLAAGLMVATNNPLSAQVLSPLSPEPNAGPIDAAPIDAAPIDDFASEGDSPLAADHEIVQERFPDGSVRIRREVTQDAEGNYINDGTWKMWDQQGNLVAQGEYRNDQRHGAWTRWNRAADSDLLSTRPYRDFPSPFLSQATFKHGQLHGSWIIYDSKQHKISELEFVDDQRHGKSTWYYPNGRMMRQIDYRDGLIDGQLLEWNAEGVLATNETFQAGRKLAPKAEHHGRTRQKKNEGVYLFAKQVIKSPDDWWNTKLATYVSQGVDEKHGPWVTWYPNGQKQLEGEYRNNLQVGEFIWWHANGQKAAHGKYDDGKSADGWVWWHKNGQKAIEGEYLYGEPSGPWTWWAEDGKVSQKAVFSANSGQIVDVTPLEEEKGAPVLQSKPSASRSRVQR